MQKIRIPQLHALLANLKPAKREIPICIGTNYSTRRRRPASVTTNGGLGESLPMEFVETDRLKRQGWNPVPIWVAGACHERTARNRSWMVSSDRFTI